ncbi:MAG: biotin--[acetyl-CoA-carboxylase] ligase [Actinomyces sp.]|uniref:biotin--[acetyl-CoA-carboxylase] ligase n=1 Tax=Actinomyces sp. TaxID=29317 RepID=UPI0026DB8BE4|nr:biotin--[acetyl-CoA-carboxylase] ligase [Actinomyces sp.]MDO4242196.1 biotin--[acetyl-CoA-carboxylase] ligase [Actinomyces sp.]
MGTSDETTTEPSPLHRLVTVETTGSTNTDLRAALVGPDGRLNPESATAWPHLSALRALSQTAGRGRGERTWTTPPTGALTFSVVLRPLVPAERLAWLPLLVGLAVSRAVSPWLEGTGWTTGTKWPNDVVVLPDKDVPPVPGWGHTRKIAGVLAELLPAGQGQPAVATAPPDREHAPAVIVGIGVNVAQDPQTLPVPWAASLTGLGAPLGGLDPDEAAGAVLHAVARRLVEVLDRWESLGGDPDAGALGAELRAACTSLGAELRVSTPGGEVLGTGVDLRPGLVVRTTAQDGATEDVVITAGDVGHTRLDAASAD